MAEERTTSSTGGQKGVKLARFDLIPVGPLTELAEHYGRGALKYANHQWRRGYEWSKSYSAMMRHQTAFWNGYDYDVCSNDPDGCAPWPDGEEPANAAEDTCFNHTGSHHMVAVAWHAFGLLEFKDEHPDHDDRYSTQRAREAAEALQERINSMWVNNTFAVRRDPAYDDAYLRGASIFDDFDQHALPDLAPYIKVVDEQRQELIDAIVSAGAWPTYFVVEGGGAIERVPNPDVEIRWRDPELTSGEALAEIQKRLSEALNRRAD